MKGNPILLGSRWTSEIKIGSLRCKCWNNVLHVGSKLLMYIVYKPGLSLSRAAKLVKWNWWCWCWSKGPAMLLVFRNLRVLRNVHIPYCLVITQHLRGTDRERQSRPLSLIKSITELIGWKNTPFFERLHEGEKGVWLFYFSQKKQKNRKCCRPSSSGIKSIFIIWDNHFKFRRPFGDISRHFRERRRAAPW